MSKKNKRLARFMQEQAGIYGTFLYSIAHAYEHADGSNQSIIDPAFDLLDQKYSLSETYKRVTGKNVKDED